MRKFEKQVPSTPPSAHANPAGDRLVVAIDAALRMLADHRWVETEWFHEILGALFALPESTRLSEDSRALCDEVADDDPPRIKGREAVNILLDIRIDATRPRRLSAV